MSPQLSPTLKAVILSIFVPLVLLISKNLSWKNSTLYLDWSHRQFPIFRTAQLFTSPGSTSHSMSSSDVTSWHPASIPSPTPVSDTSPFAIIVLNQPLELRSSIYETLFHNAHFKIAADGGANRLVDIKPTPSLDLIIGDLDSLSETSTAYWEDQGVKIVKDHDQYSTDFGKAFNWIRKEVPEKLDIVVLGGLGGRLDQGLSVLHHLYMFQATPNYADGKMFLLSSEAISFLLKAGKHRIKVKEMFEEAGVGLGKHIGIIPMKEASVISTKGLEWDVQDWKTEFGGLMSTSNLVREEWVDVETTKDVLFTIDLDLGEGTE